MSKKLQGNGLFESSRMMLPEHKEAFIRHQQDLAKKQRPLLDDQELERLSRIMAKALSTGSEVTIALFDDFTERKVSGKVTHIDPCARKIKLKNKTGRCVIPLDQIIGIEE